MIPAGVVRERYGVRILQWPWGYRLVGWSAQISTFPLLHVDTWLSLGAALPKEGDNVLGHCKTGDAGRGQASMQSLNLPLSAPLYLNYWCHSMARIPLDWHCSVELYYE